MLERRLQAFYHLSKLKEPTWAKVTYPPIDYRNIIYYAAPKQKVQLNSLEEADPELLATFNGKSVGLDL